MSKDEILKAFMQLSSDDIKHISNLLKGYESISEFENYIKERGLKACQKENEPQADI